MQALLRLFLFAGLISFGGVLKGQDTIRGVVTDETGEPLIGASIWIMGTEQGTITDLDGRFTLSLPTGSVMLRVSYTGFTSKEFEYHNGVRKDLKDNFFVLVEACIRCYFDVQYLSVGLQVGVNDGFTRLDLEFTPTIVGKGTLYLRTSQRIGRQLNSSADYAIGVYHLVYDCDFQLDTEIDHLRYATPECLTYRTGLLADYRGYRILNDRLAIGLGLGQAHEYNRIDNLVTVDWLSARLRLKYYIPIRRVGWIEILFDGVNVRKEISVRREIKFRHKGFELAISSRSYKGYEEIVFGGSYSIPVR